MGPALSGVLLMASSAPERGFLLIGVYTLGFVIPFLLVGLFTGTVLDLFKNTTTSCGIPPASAPSC